MNSPIAVAVADIHLSLNRPACRDDKDWMAVQASYLEQLKILAADLPILCAGDIFDHWKATPELISFALDELPDDMLCVPGQHDLPNHRIEDMRRSGYGVLKRAGKIRDISGCATGNLGGFMVHGFGWNQPIRPVKKDGLMHIALIHKHIWIRGATFPYAPAEAHLSQLISKLKGYDVAVFGDNHKGFYQKARGTMVLNCGTFIRRKADEIPYRPAVSFIYSDGSVERVPLATDRDCFQERPEEREEVTVNMREFLEQLEGLGEHGMDFREVVKQHLLRSDIRPEVEQIILSALEHKS